MFQLDFVPLRMCGKLSADCCHSLASLRGEMSDEVIIFAKPGCPFCAAAKEDFRKRGVTFTEHNVLADRDARERMLALNGGKRAVPTILQGGRVTIGFKGS